MKKKKIIAFAILIAVITVIAAIAAYVCLPVLKKADDPEELRIYIEGMGMWGVAFFIMVTVIQVVAAFIPGGPLEIAAGYCFGMIPGAIICDIGMTLGSMVVFLLVRRFGMAFIEIFFSREKIESLKFLKTNGQSRLVIFLLFLIPGTPKDILAYGVGLTDLSLVSWILITSVGRFPSILLSTMSGDALGEQRNGTFIVVIIVIAALGATGALAYRIWLKKKSGDADEQVEQISERQEN
jgi:uncharacterized membrane protein YdjX (TVP38/TMEM64 family)